MFRNESMLFETVFNASPAGMALVSLKGEFLRTNKSFRRIVGYSEEELLKMNFQSITFPDNLDIDLTHMKECLEGEINEYEMEKRYFTKDGRIIWILLSASLIRKADKPEIFIAQIQDITEIKLLKERMTVALNSGGIGIWTWYAKNDLLIWDKTMFPLYDIEERDFVPNYAFFINKVYIEDRASVEANVKEALHGNGEFHTKFRIFLKDGSVRWIEGRGKVTVDSLGNIAMMSGINMDITDLIFAEERLDKISNVLISKIKGVGHGKASEESRDEENSYEV